MTENLSDEVFEEIGELSKKIEDNCDRIRALEIEIEYLTSNNQGSGFRARSYED